MSETDGKPFSKWASPPGHFEVRRQGKEVDEIVAVGCAIHIERMTGNSWFILIETPDGTGHCFWLGAANYKSRVEVRHSETRPAPPALSPQEGGATKDG